jgi:uncharacterized membrane protein YfcA
VTGRDRLAGLAAGFTAGFAGGLFGVGGGAVLIPILTRRFGLTQHQAHGTSLAVLGATALPGVVVYALLGRVEWATALVVLIASVVTAGIGARLASRLSGPALRRAFALFLVAVAIRLLWKLPAVRHAGDLTDLSRIAIDLGVGAVTGLFSGFMGVGGGVIAVPAFALILGMSQQVAQGTSLAVVLGTGPAGAIAHARRGNVVGRWVPMLAIGAALGSPLASWIANRLPQALLVRMFAVFLIANAVHTWFRSGSPGSGVAGKPRPATA